MMHTATVLFFLFLCLFSGSSVSVAQGETENTITIVAWNIEWYPGKRPYARAEEMRQHAAIAQAALARINPDIFLAQEIRNWQSFAELTDAVPDLRPVVVSSFPSSRTGEYWRQQLAIASKLPVKAAWSEGWQAGGLQPDRGFSAAAIRVPGSYHVILVYSLHLKSNRSSNEREARFNYKLREESIRQLLEHVRHMEDTVFKDLIVGVIVGGDFNTNQDEQFGDNVMQQMQDGGFYQTWGNTPREARLTWRGSNRFEPTTFDHIFTKGLGQPQAELLEVPEATSDHWPVRITVPHSALRK